MTLASAEPIMLAGQLRIARMDAAQIIAFAGAPATDDRKENRAMRSPSREPLRSEGFPIV